MTLSEFDIKRCEQLVAEFIERRRPSPRLRKEVDLAFRIKGPSVEIFEIRAHRTRKGKPVEHRIAKATYLKGDDPKWTFAFISGAISPRRYRGLAGASAQADPCTHCPTETARITARNKSVRCEAVHTRVAAIELVETVQAYSTYRTERIMP